MDEIKERILRRFDSEVMSLSKEDYKELLEEVISDLESRLDCVNDELQNED